MGEDAARQEKLDVEMEAPSVGSPGLPGSATRWRHITDHTSAGEHVDHLPQTPWAEGGLPTFVHPIWTPTWALERDQ